MVVLFGCGIGIRSRLRADKTPQNEFCRDPKSGSALNNPTKRVLWGPRVPRTVIHSRPVRIQPIHNKKTDRQKPICFYGCGIGIRTPTNRVRVCRAAVTQFRNILLHISCAKIILSPFFEKVKSLNTFFLIFNNFSLDKRNKKNKMLGY